MGGAVSSYVPFLGSLRIARPVRQRERYGKSPVGA